MAVDVLSSLIYINPNDEDALICRSEEDISTIGDWFLHPTEMSIDENYMC